MSRKLARAVRAAGAGERRPGAARHLLSRFHSDRRGTTAIMVAVSIVPIMAAMGLGLDIYRIANAQAQVQNAADAAALAGAVLYTTEAQASSAQSAALKYFDQYIMPFTDMTVASKTATTTTASASQPYYRVTVDATATISTTLMQWAGFNTMTVTAHAVGGFPAVVPVVTMGQGGGAPSQVLGASGVKSSAADWNSVYMYGVPMNNGTPVYSTFPPLSQLYEAGSNCNSATDSNWTSNSPCNSGFGAVAPANQTLSITPDTPISFLFVNMNNGMFPAGARGNYGPNQYGSQPGWYQLMSTAWMSLGKSPSAYTDNSVSYIRNFGFQNSQGATHYSDVNNTSKPNCAIQIQQVDPSNIPANPPQAGTASNKLCFSATDPSSGYQYANLSCKQIAGRTFMYWWNDMGAPVDDTDYKNLYFTLTCVYGVTSSSDGGTLGANQTPTGVPPVARLMQ